MRAVIRNSASAAAVLVGAAFLLAGCSRGASQAVRKQFEEVYSIDPNATLSFVNFNGSATIRASDLPTLEVHAVITAPNAQRLNEMAVEVRARDDHASVITRFPPEKGRIDAMAGHVDYVIQVPRATRISRLEVENGRLSIEGMRSPEINATIIDGSLAVHNCFGNARLSVSNGSLEVSFDRWQQQRDPFSLNAYIIHGNARVVIPTGASLHLVADAPRGKVINRLAEIVELNGRSASPVDLKVGGAERSELAIRATTGDIEILSSQTLAKENAM